MAVKESEPTTSVYEASQDPPEDYIRSISLSAKKPATPSRPSFGLDSLAGLLYSNISFPLYLYASLHGKHLVWDDLLAALPDASFVPPALDVGCGRGMVLLKTAERKKALVAGGTAVHPAYGMDIFSTADQTGNSPEATYRNAAALGVLDLTVLHSADFTAQFPFADGAFGLVTSNLAIHNVGKEGRLAALREIARVCAPGGRLILVDLYGFFKDHVTTLTALGWDEVEVHGAGLRMMFGILPCQILKAHKPGG